MDFLGSMIEVECNTLLIWKGRFGAEVDWTPKFKDAFPKARGGRSAASTLLARCRQKAL